MITLMKLELRRINLRPYCISSAMFGIFLLAFTYFAAYVAQVEQETQFMNYANLLRLTRAVSIILFGVLSAAMYVKLITEEYSGKRLALLFSYPVSRKKIFAAKVLVVLSFVCISMLLCTGIPNLIFVASEWCFPIVDDTMSIDLFIQELKAAAASISAVSAIGLLAMGIGFIKKSVILTMVCAFVLSGMYGNLSIASAENPAIAFLTAGVSLAVILAVLLTLSKKINHMEVR